MNALIMGASSLFMRTVSVCWSAYVANKIGAEGSGLFSLIMSVYAFAVTLACSGINLAVMRLVSQEIGLGNDKNAVSIMKKCVGYCLFFGIGAGILLFSLSGVIANTILCDGRTALSLRALSVSLPFIALSNVFSGYFSAVRRVYKNAASSITEQFVKIGITVVFLLIIAPRGIEYACLALVLGSCIAEALSFFYMFVLYIFDKKKHLSGKNSNEERKNFLSQIVGIAIPIALSSYLRSGLVTVEHVLIPIGLKKSGADAAAALASYGTIHGMVLPLILFPSAVCITFASLIIPELSELDAKYTTVYQNTHICYIVKRAVKFVSVFAIGTAGIFICFSKPLGNLIYPGTDAAKYIGIFAAAIPVMYTDTAVDGMLKGLGQQLSSMKYNIIDAAVSVILVYTLLPRLGIYGYVICVFVCEILNFSLSMGRLIAVTGASISLPAITAAPVCCIAGAASLSLIICRIFGIVLDTAPKCAAAIITTIIFYLLLMAGVSAVSREEINWFRSVFKKES